MGGGARLEIDGGAQESWKDEINPKSYHDYAGVENEFLHRNSAGLSSVFSDIGMSATALIRCRFLLADAFCGVDK